MIIDLDGATTESSRRRHVAVLSAAATAVSLVLLIALVGPAPRTASALLAVNASSPARMVVLSASDSTTSGYDQVASQLGDETISFCVAGIGSSPPVHLVLARSGRVIAAYTSGRTGRFIPLPPAYLISGWATVPCDTSDVFAPRLNRAR